MLFNVTNKERRFPMEQLNDLNVQDCIDFIVVPDAKKFESIDAFCVMVKDKMTSRRLVASPIKQCFNHKSA
jgi:hypothetical protein